MPGWTACDACADLAARLRAAIPDTPAPDLVAGVRARVAANRGKRRLRKIAGALLRLAAGGALAFGVWRAISRRAPADGGTGTAWLAATQAPDGSWDTARWGAQPAYDVAVSALATLALWSAPESARVEARRAVEALLRRQDAATGRFGPPGPGAMYNHGMAAAALGRARAELPPDAAPEAWGAAAARARDFIAAAQRADGSWGYTAGETGAGNASVTLWQLYALRAGGWTNDPAYARGLRWLRRALNPAGQMGYRAPNDTPAEGGWTLTAGGLPLLRDALDDEALLRRMGDDVRRRAAELNAQNDYYAAFFLAAALDGTPDAAPLAKSLRAALVACRTRRGPQRGSWDASDRWGGVGGRLYATAAASLALTSVPR